MDVRFWLGLVVGLAALPPVVACSDEPNERGAAGAASATAGSSGSAGTAGAGGETIESLVAIQTSIFDGSCSFSSCHSPEGNRGDLVLGKSAVVASSQLHAALVGVTSSIDPALVRVKAGDPTGSFLLDKLRAGQRGFEFTHCDEQKNLCGDPMPQGAPALPDASIERIERWIAQGALDN